MPPTIQTLVWALVAFQAKHLLADFLLQTKWMMAGKERLRGWLAPLTAHAAAHAAMTLCIALWLNPALWWLGAVDLAVHAAVDRGKSVLAFGLGTHDGERIWWRIFGVDQTLHHLTHLAYAVVLVLH